MNQIYPPSLCPRFDRCSVNNCPLDPNYPNLLVNPLDKEKKCPMEKGVRSRIGNQFPELLPMLGLTRAEWGNTQAYLKKPLAVRTALAEKAQDSLNAFRKRKSSQ